MDDLKRKYEDGGKAEKIKNLTASLKEEKKKASSALDQAIAGFRSQWAGLNEKGEVGVGKGTPGIYYNTAAIPSLLGLVDEKYAPEFSVEADKQAGRIKEAVRKQMGIDEPKGALQHFAYAGGEMLGQIPVPGALLNKALGTVKKAGLAGKVAAAPVEYLSPIVDPKAINYGIGTGFGGTIGVIGEALEDPVKKELGGLIQKYEKGGKVGRFFSAIDKAIETLKQKKGTGEQILKQLETTPGVKKEELETRGIRQKLQTTPKITQEELRQAAQRNKAPIPQRTILGAGVPEDYEFKLTDKSKNILQKYEIEPIVDPEDRTNMGFFDGRIGDVIDPETILRMGPEDIDVRSPEDYRELMAAFRAANKRFQMDLDKYETKYKKYSQPGGENYREVMVHLPESASAGLSMKRNRLAELLSGRNIEELDPESRFEAMTLMDELTVPVKEFVAGHYDTPNILTHFRISDRVGPNGEKILYVDEIQSDWHQKARDARKSYIQSVLNKEFDSIHQRALEQLRASGSGFNITPENEREFERIRSRLTKERKTELEKEIPKDFGYRKPEDEKAAAELEEKINRIHMDGLTIDEIKDYYKPGTIVKSGGGYDKVLSFNTGEKSPGYQREYDKALERALSIGNIDEETAKQYARNKALEASKNTWSVKVIAVDPATGKPVPGAFEREHFTSPADHIIRGLSNELEAIEIKKPDAPFKDTWHELAVKEIFDIAAKEGYDKVAFSPGIEQVKRYSNELRQAIDEIRVAPKPNGEGLMVVGLKGADTKFTGDVVDGLFVNGPAKGKTVSEVFGSNIAKQIEEPLENVSGTQAIPMPRMSADELLATHSDQMTQEQKSWLRDFISDWENNAQNPRFIESLTEDYDRWLHKQTLNENTSGQMRTITGEDLAVGGEGMKSFYDKRVPDFVRSYAGKEFDAKTGYEDIVMTGGREGAPTWQEIEDMIDTLSLDDEDVGRSIGYHMNEEVENILSRRGITDADPNYDSLYNDTYNNLPFSTVDRINEIGLREAAEERLKKQEGKTLRAFTVDVTPKMRERIQAEGQRLFAAAPVVGLGVAQTEQPAFDPEGSDYDYETAKSAGMGPEASGENQGHWGSVTQTRPEDRQKYGLPEDSYMLLKGRQHETWNLAEEAEKERGAEIIKRGNRYFSVPKGSIAPEPSQEPLGGPQGFQDGGKVGMVRKAAEKFSEALRGARGF